MTYLRRRITSLESAKNFQFVPDSLIMIMQVEMESKETGFVFENALSFYLPKRWRVTGVWYY